MASKSKTAVATDYAAYAERQNATARQLEAEGDLENAAHYRAAARHFHEKAESVVATVLPTQVALGEAMSGANMIVRGPKNTLRTPDQVALDASAHRKELLIGTHIDVAAMALDASESIEANNSLEKMLAHQMALAHVMAFQLADRAMGATDPQVVTKFAGMSARLMDTFQRGLTTMQRLRSGNTQVVTVQHVQISGGQTVVAGALATGGAKGGSR